MLWHAYLITEGAVLGAALIAALAVSAATGAWHRIGSRRAVVHAAEEIARGNRS